MKLTAQVKLVTTSAQVDALKQTLRDANACCNRISAWCWANRVFGQYAIHKAVYAQERITSRLTAQVVVRCIGRVADAYKSAFTLHEIRVEQVKEANEWRNANGKTLLPMPVMEACEFREHGSIPFDDRILRWYVERSEVSVWTVNGRMKVPFVCGDYQRRLLAFRHGESDLAFVNGNFYLMPTISMVDPPLIETDGVIGVDFGIVRVAADSDGNVYSGEQITEVRRRAQKHTTGLQKCGSRRAKRTLKKIGNRVHRFQKHVNHVISKQIVQRALSSRKAICIEDLTGIRERSLGFRRDMRWRIGNWAFFQLRSFIEYKAKRVGIPVAVVDPRNTSRTCSECGYCDKRNRKTQSEFLCLQCGFSANADFNAARNLEARGQVNSPIVATFGLAAKPLALAGD